MGIYILAHRENVTDFIGPNVGVICILGSLGLQKNAPNM